MQTELARQQMITQQVRAWDVLDERVLGVLGRVPREQFVPADHRYLAFADVDVPLPCAEHMLRPSVAGRLLQALDIEPNERVLEIGAGTGFVTACLTAAGAHVRALEIHPELARAAQANLSALGMLQAEVIAVDAMLPLGATRYNAIALTASLPLYDERWQRQLEVGGRLFVIVGEPPVMEARLVRRFSEDNWSAESLFETVVDPLINAPRRAEFVF